MCEPVRYIYGCKMDARENEFSDGKLKERISLCAEQATSREPRQIMKKKKNAIRVEASRS